jgi:Abortive infection alpha
LSEYPEERNGVASIPGLLRIGASAWLHTAEWAVQTSLRAGRRVIGVAISPETAPQLVDDLREVAGKTLRELIEATEIDDRLRDAGVPLGRSGDTEPGTGADGTAPNLRVEGAELLYRSRDVHYSEDAHPAYERILTELAPDEARILRLLLLDGPQPSVDVRTGGPIGMVSSRLVAPGLTMIGARAGCRYVERVPSYLNNLFRLGMVWFSRETLRDPQRYQVLEAQPDVQEAIHSVRYAKIVRRSIHLTPFGEDFCRVCFIEDDEQASALPEHSLPPDADKTPQPPTLPEDE